MKLLLENWREYLSDSEEYLYHATYEPLLGSIIENGLGATGRTNWEDSKPGVVYLALDPLVSESYAETSERVPEEWLGQIVVLKIKTSNLESSKLFSDGNVLDGNDTLEYHGVIPPEHIEKENKK
tara:strand:- start:3286 stop:3660 length:375 start_codon:yes stop_codon:yes gene_type:complete